jgi:hypothetical protein
MRYEMQNFIKMTKQKPSNVGQKSARDEWKRARKIARQAKLNLRKSVA